MSFPDPIPIHPVDLLFGATIPEVQCYVVAGPRLQRPEALRPLLSELLTDRFPRLCYRLVQRLGLIRSLRLATDFTAPLEILGEADGLQPVRNVHASGLGDRHWRLFVVPAGDATYLLLLFDHYLCHGHTAQQLLFALFDRLFGAPTEVAPPGDAYRALQVELSEIFRTGADWAAYHRLSLPSGPLRELAMSLGLPFTETAMLWLARTIHDVAVQPRPMEIISFRMDRDVAIEARVDPEYGNRGLRAELYEMLPDGFYSVVDPSLGLGQRNLDEFVDFYRAFPLKGTLTWFIRRSIDKGKRDSRRQNREKLVVNNLGDTTYPFFRTMFFDPFNDADRFGLVFVDSCQGELTLQFAPPLRYLERFGWGTFEERLLENAEGMKSDPRIATR